MSIPATPFNAIQGNGKQVVLRPVNEYDITSIISIYPRNVDVVMHTIFPGTFHIPKGTKQVPTIVVIGQSSYFLDTQPDTTMPIIEVPNSSKQVADSIINDYCAGLLEASPMQMPGLFCVPGKVNVAEVLSTHKELLERAEVRQNAWFHKLINEADVMWVRSQGNPNAISDLARMAAEETNNKSKPWMQNTVAQTLINCTMCGALRNPAYPVCPNCKHVIDAPLAEKRVTK